MTQYPHLSRFYFDYVTTFSYFLTLVTVTYNYAHILQQLQLKFKRLSGSRNCKTMKIENLRTQNRKDFIDISVWKYIKLLLTK